MRRRPAEPLDVELADLPPEQRWRVWMGRVEAVIFAAATPVDRASLARLVGQSCNLDLIIADIRRELGGRPYELVAVAGGWQFRTRAAYAPVLQAALGVDDQARSLSRGETLVLTAIAYLQPVTRGELGRLIGREVSRDTIGYLTRLDSKRSARTRVLVMSARPGRVVIDRKVELPGDGPDTVRDPSVTATPEFQALRTELAAAIYAAHG